MSAMVLKLTAIVCMLIDHIGHTLYYTLVYLPHINEFSVLLRGIGRIAFPIFAFLIAEGMRKTKSRPMYLLWLGAFAVISVVPFSLFRNIWMRGGVFFDFERQNVFFTLFLGAASIYLFDLIREKLKGFHKGIPGYILGFAGPALCAAASHFMGIDYGDYGWGMLVIFATYWVMSIKDNRFLRVIPLIIWIQLQYSGANAGYSGLLPAWLMNSEGFYYQAGFALVAALLIMLYDGSPGSAKLRGSFKIAFYMFYPAHMLVLYGWSIFLRNFT